MVPLLEEEEILDLEQEVVREELDHQETQVVEALLAATSIKVDMAQETLETVDQAVAAVVVWAAVKAAVILVDLVVAVVQDTPTQLTLQMQR